MNSISRLVWLVGVLLLVGVLSFAQGGQDLLWGFDSRKLVETKWKYTYTLQKETNTILHQAGDDYKYFLHFRYNNTYQEYLNGQFKNGGWEIDGNILHYQFKEFDDFQIVRLDKGALVLEFTQPTTLGKYQYHFVRVNSEETPFQKPAYELPDVIVETKAPTRKKRSRWWRNIFTRNAEKHKKLNIVGNGKYISIELIGGGYYGGINPVVVDFIQIKSDGRLIKEFRSKSQGKQLNKTYIPRSELELFMDYVEAQQFFDMNRIYDCSDILCQNRKKQKPRPIPLRLSITYGDKKRIVTSMIWGLDKHKINYVDVPDGLNNIIYAIQEMGNRTVLY